MSFGFSVGDFAGTLQLAWTLYTKCYKIAKGAPKDFKCLIEEINMLHSSIKLLQDEATDKESVLVRAGPDRVDMVKRVVGQVDITLGELAKHSKKYESLGKEHSSSIRKWWTGVRWSTEASELDALRNKLVYHNGVISLLLTSCGNSSLQRIETITTKVEKGVNDIKDMIRSPRAGAPTISAIQGDRLFSISLSETLMKNAEMGRKWSAIGVDEWIQAGSWWLLKSQMDLYTGLPSECKISWQGYANLIKAAWILIDIITRHPQLDFLETSTAYSVELLVETIRRELENINNSGVARPTFAELGTCDLAIWETQVKGPTLKPHLETSSSGLSRQAWMTENEYVLFQRFVYYQANSYAVENPCIVLFLIHKTVKEAKIVLRDQSWYTWATFTVRDVTPYPNGDTMQIGDQKVRFSTTQDVQHLCAISEAIKEYLLDYKFKENDPEILRSFTLLFSIKNNYGGVVGRLREDEVYTEAEKLRENTRVTKYSTRLRLAVNELAKSAEQPILTGRLKVKSTSENLPLFVWCVRKEYNAVAALLSEGKGISISKEDLILCSPISLPNAALHKKVELIKLLVSENWSDIDARGCSIDSLDRLTALEIASQTGLIVAVNILLEAGANSHGTSFRALSKAACSGHLDVVNRLLDAGADVNAGIYKALSSAAEEGHLDVVNRLLDAGADVNGGYYQALYSAAKGGHLDVVNRLLDAGADVNGGYYQALSEVARGGHLDVVNRLLDAGADVNGGSIKALSEAAEGGHLDVVNRLLDAGADVNGGDCQALYSAAEGGHLDVVNRLLDAGADVNGGDYQALSAAAEGGHLDVVNRLLDTGADVNGASSEALSEAAEGGHLDVVNRLLDAGADVNGGDYRALSGAAKGGHLNLVNRLLDAGADVNGGSSEALSAAAEGGHLDVVNRLLNAGADVNGASSEALSEAAEGGHLDVVNRLLDAGADVNRDSSRAFNSAIREDHFVIAVKLFKAGADIQSLSEEAREKFESWMRKNNISMS